MEVLFFTPTTDNQKPFYKPKKFPIRHYRFQSYQRVLSKTVLLSS